MKSFTLDAGMTAAIGGAFYPTGHTMVMFPSAGDARQVGEQLLAHGFDGDDIYLIPPDVMLREIAPTVRTADEPLPSAGTDAATVRAFALRARQGDTALLVRTPDDPAAQRLMTVAGRVPYSIAQRYRRLVIETL